MVLAAPRVEFEHEHDYRHQVTAPVTKVRWLDIPARRYLLIEGTAAPGDPGFRDAIATLYPVAYTLHFALKERGIEAPVGALEGLYWIDEPGPITAAQFAGGPEVRTRWTWRLMLPVPDAATTEDCRAAIDAAGTRKRPPLLDQLRIEALDEGEVAQVMHIGRYDAEAPTIERLHQAIAEAGLRARGCHHEVYISDPNRTAPERMKTLIRQPVEEP